MIFTYLYCLSVRSSSVTISVVNYMTNMGCTHFHIYVPSSIDTLFRKFQPHIFPAFYIYHDNAI